MKNNSKRIRSTAAELLAEVRENYIHGYIITSFESKRHKAQLSLLCSMGLISHRCYIRAIRIINRTETTNERKPVGFKTFIE